MNIKYHRYDWHHQWLRLAWLYQYARIRIYPITNTILNLRYKFYKKEKKNPFKHYFDMSKHWIEDLNPKKRFFNL